MLTHSDSKCKAAANTKVLVILGLVTKDCHEQQLLDCAHEARQQDSPYVLCYVKRKLERSTQVLELLKLICVASARECSIW